MGRGVHANTRSPDRISSLTGTTPAMETAKVAMDKMDALCGSLGNAIATLPVTRGGGAHPKNSR